MHQIMSRKLFAMIANIWLINMAIRKTILDIVVSLIADAMVLGYVWLQAAQIALHVR
jgi:hypothetical protein